MSKNYGRTLPANVLGIKTWFVYFFYLRVWLRHSVHTKMHRTAEVSKYIS